MNICDNRWQRMNLQLSSALAEIICSQLFVHPWVPGAGRTTDNGPYLSPVNAIDWIGRKLQGHGGEAESIALLLCAPDMGNFISQLSGLGAVLPLPELGRITRMAKTQVTHAINRMQIPAPHFAGLPAPERLSTTSTRSLLAAAKVVAATQPGESSLSKLNDAMVKFKQQRAQMLQQLAQESSALQQASCNVWAFCGSGDIHVMRLAMQENVPEPSAVLAFLAVFVGKDLTTLRGMLLPHEEARPWGK